MPTAIALPPMLPRVITMAMTPATVHSPPRYDRMGSAPVPPVTAVAASANPDEDVKVGIEAQPASTSGIVSANFNLILPADQGDRQGLQFDYA